MAVLLLPLPAAAAKAGPGNASAVRAPVAAAELSESPGTSPAELSSVCGQLSMVFAETESGEIPADPFSDITGHWGESYIVKAAELGLFTGFEDATFRPDEPVTRSQYVTVIWRMAGSPPVTENAPFSDVPEGKWYSDAIAWAYERGLVKGRSEGIFDPQGSISRQEAMKILFDLNGGVSGTESLFTGLYDEGFTDSSQIADWAKPAMYWGFYNGIIAEKDTASTLCPTNTATRAEVAKMLVIYIELLSAGSI